MDMHPLDPTAPFLQSNDNSEQVRQHGDYVIVGLHTDPEVNRWERKKSQIIKTMTSTIITALEMPQNTNLAVFNIVQNGGSNPC